MILLLGIAIGLALGNAFFSDSNIVSDSFFPGFRRIRTDLDKFAPKFYSEGNEEIIIRHFFCDRRDGFFLDVGAYHYKDKSNTYYLEKNLGWHGIAVDANGEFERDYLEFRSHTKYFVFFVSDKSDEQAEFYIVKDPGHLTKSTAVKSFIKGRETEKIVVPTIRLDDLLSKLDIAKIDFFNLDIELWEPYALAGFHIEKYRPSLVCIEAHPPVQQQILNYFSGHGYRRLDQYLFFDKRNWYFAAKDIP